MKRRSLGLLTVAALALMVLPSLPGCETLTETASQNRNKVNRALYINTMLLTDDWEMMALIDRPSWLSHKPMPDY